MRTLHDILLMLAIVGTAPMPASAHTIVVEAFPGPDEAVAGPDIQIQLKLNGRIDPTRSRLILTKPDGTTNNVKIDLDAAPGMFIGMAKALAPGGYTLRWQVLSIDGHITRGDIPFSVKQ